MYTCMPEYKDVKVLLAPTKQMLTQLASCETKEYQPTVCSFT